jgi:hypothetical protein
MLPLPAEPVLLALAALSPSFSPFSLLKLVLSLFTDRTTPWDASACCCFFLPT